MFGNTEAIVELDRQMGAIYGRVKRLERDKSGAEQRLGDLKSRADHANERLDKLTANNEALTKRLLCMEDYGGHDWVFVAKMGHVAYSGDTHNPYAISTWLLGRPEYEFKCSRCGHTRSFPWDELNKKEQDALTAIGLGGA